ncbi:MAG TPA: hypothetical protein VK835_14805, partial [Bacteroidia bacterium]|nr:hypothetical protein [Bacteroidia bacterium]
RKIPVNPKGPSFIYSTPDVARTSIDSLGGIKIQPMAQFAGNHFTFAATIGTNYKVDFYLNLANTIAGDTAVISYDANNGAGYSYYYLNHTGHYSYTLQAPDTLFDFKILYYGIGNTPHDYMLFDSLQITEVGNTNDTIVAYTADIRSVSDVSPFGAPLPGRTWSSNSYRYGMNGQEKDDEVYGVGNLNTAEFWEYDTRLGRRWNTDPVVKEWESPYATFANNPSLMVDPNGADAGTKKVDNGDGTGQATINTTIYMVNGGVSATQFNNYVNGYTGRIQGVYNGQQFTENGVAYSLTVNVNIVVAGSVAQAKQLMQQAGGKGTSNILTVGTQDPNPGMNPLNLLQNDSKIYGSGNQGFANVNQPGADAHEFGHLIGLGDRYDYFVNVKSYNDGILATHPKGQSTGSAPKWLPRDYDEEYANNRSGNMMSIGGAGGVLTNQQKTFIFSHGSNITPGTGEKENFGTLSTYFFQNSNAGVPAVLGDPSVKYYGTYRPGFLPSGKGGALYQQHQNTVNTFYGR